MIYHRAARFALLVRLRSRRAIVLHARIIDGRVNQLIT